jgi:hypothetical protein
LRLDLTETRVQVGQAEAGSHKRPEFRQEKSEVGPAKRSEFRKEKAETVSHKRPDCK